MQLRNLVFIPLAFIFLCGSITLAISEDKPASLADLLPKDFWQKQKLDIQLVHAVVSGNAQKAKYWLGQGAHPDAVQGIGKPGTLFGAAGGPSVVMLAALRGDTPMVQLLLDKGANVNFEDALSHETALVAAAMNGHTQTVNLLLSRGAKVNPQTKGAASALMAAVSENHPVIFKILLDKGADVNCKAEEGMTALMVAASSGNIQMVKEMLNRGADVNSKTGPENPSQTALTFAKQTRHSDIVALLLKAGATEEKGENP